MIVVRHQCQILAGRADAFEQAQQVVGVAIGHEPLRPVCDGFGADPDILQMCEVRRQERLDIILQRTRIHHERVATGDQNVGNLLVLTKVCDQLL